MTTDDLLFSQTATRMGYKEQFNPPLLVKKNLLNLLINFIYPFEKKTGLKIIVSSGYRCERLNKKIGGALTSQHVQGEAIDFSVIGKTTLEICKIIAKSGIKVDQVIEEFGSWVHVSLKIEGNRNEFLQAKKIKGKTVYQKFVF